MRSTQLHQHLSPAPNVDEESMYKANYKNIIEQKKLELPQN